MKVKTLIEMLQDLPMEHDVFVPTTNADDGGDFVDAYYVKKMDLVIPKDYASDDDEDDDEITEEVVVIGPWNN